MRTSSKRPRVESYDVAPPLPSSIGDTTTDEPVDHATDADVPLSPTSNDSDIRRMLKTVMIVQTAHGQILVDILDELRALRVDLEHLRQSPAPPPFDDV